MEISKQNYLSNLNNYQREAILDPNGPCLIVAGAGSGKTKVLTTRVVHIIKKKKAWPNQILCVTFTNKAARELQDRITKFLNYWDKNIDGPIKEVYIYDQGQSEVRLVDRKFKLN